MNKQIGGGQRQGLAGSSLINGQGLAGIGWSDARQ